MTRPLPRIAGSTPGDRLAALRAAAPGRIVLTTSFGLEDQALTHLIRAARLEIDIVTIDTGRLFPETYRLWQETEERYAVRIRSFYPDGAALAALLADSGANGFYFSKAARLDCCGVRKVEPLRHALAGADAWVTGLRADQSGARRDVALAGWDDAHGLVKVAPLFDWTRQQVADFCTAEEVPVSALHARGFLSIGCEPCTRAVRPGEPERAGRWWWESDEARECGLHLAPDERPQRRAA